MILVKRISTILQDKFDGPYYNWSCTPPDIQDRFFIQLAHRYTWDPVITPLVREEFDAIAQRRLKGMINYVRTHKKRPRWIRPTLWREMEDHWKTPEAQERSTVASNARNSDRDGLGTHTHVGGPKSYTQIEREMEAELGRPVSVGEVFLRTHTRKDGTYVDEKAKRIAEAYDQNLKNKLSDLEPTVTADGTAQPPELTVDQMNEIFIQSTAEDDRGNLYGLGRLALVHGKGKKKTTPGSSSATIRALQDQLQEARRKIELQEAANARREEESRQSKLQLEMLMKYLNNKDPDLAAWMETQCNQGNASTAPSSSDTT